jgi:hypothetical protein
MNPQRTPAPDDENTPPDGSIMSKERRKLDALFSIKRTRNGIDDAINILTDGHKVLTNPNSSKRETRSVLADIKNIVIPYGNHAGQVIESETKRLHNIASLQYSFNCDEVDRRQALETERIPINVARLGSPQRRLFQLMRASDSNDRSATRSNDQNDRRRTKKRKAGRTLPLQVTIDLPTPSNGRSYSKTEFLLIMSLHTSKKERSTLIDKLVDTEQVPVGRATMYRALKREREGLPNDRPWNARGAPRLISKEGLIEIRSHLDMMGGKTIGSREVRERIVEFQQDAIRSQGRVPIGAHIVPTQQTIRNYSARLAAMNGMDFSQRTTIKSATRYTAENSLISSMAFLLLVASTHYVVTRQKNQKVYKDVEDAPKGALKLFRLVQEAHGGLPIFPIKPSHMTTTDDTVAYVFDGRGMGKDQFRLLSQKSNLKAGTLSKYSQGEQIHCNGLRVKITYSFNGAGASAPVFVSVTGLTEHELPKEAVPSGLLALKIQGLCVGGTGINLGEMPAGWLVFIRNDNDGEAEKKRYRFYRENVFIPFLNDIRKEYDGWVEKSNIEDESTIISWQDGDFAQVATLTEDETLENFRALKVVLNKQNPARSATEQAADLAKVFKLIKQLVQTVTVADLPADQSPLKRAIAAQFQALTAQGKLNLRPNKYKALIDFIACLPEMLTKACTRENIVHGSTANGMLDQKKRRFPDFDNLLGTCRKHPTVEEYKLCEDSFKELFEYQFMHGHVPDDKFDEFGFPQDEDPNGKKVRREATLSQETHQRAKCLSHKHQVELRSLRRSEVEAVSKRKKAVVDNRVMKHLNVNVQCQEKLRNFGEATFEDFAKCRGDELTSFLFVRDPTISVSKLPKKGKVADAEAGVDCLILRAFGARAKPIQLRDPTDASEDTEQDAASSEPLPAHRAIEIIEVRTDSARWTCDEQASAFLENKDWISAVKFCFDPQGKSIQTDSTAVSDEMKARADSLQVQLTARLASHVSCRVNDEAKHNHWSLRWAASNFARLAAVMILFSHVKEDLECLDATDSLLAPIGNFLLATNAESQLEGAYLYADKNRGKWVRSGKVIGRSFAVRGGEHAKAAWLKTSRDQASKFYSSYPSKNAQLYSTGGRRGWFENLEQCVALGFDRRQNGVITSLKEIVFLFDADSKVKVGRVNFAGTSSLEQKQLHMVGYLCELAYDLGLGLLDNVSSNPGFETCLGVF